MGLRDDLVHFSGPEMSSDSLLCLSFIKATHKTLVISRDGVGGEGWSMFVLQLQFSFKAAEDSKNDKLHL